MKSKTTRGLRFAAWTRVSTDAQEQQGYSLQMQRAAIEAAVERMGGKIVARYGGAESATAGHERDKFDRMLADAKAHQFDAVIVYDLSRWSRDPITGGLGAAVLRDNGIRLFELERERDLFSASDAFMLDVLAAVSKHSVEERLSKARPSRIKMAERGFPTSGGPGNGPWHLTLRNWDARHSDSAKADWALIPERADVLRRCYSMVAERDLTWQNVAATMRTDPLFIAASGTKTFPTNARLANTLRRRCLAAGGTWTQEFLNNRRQRVQTPAKVPAVFSADQLGLLARVSARNRIARERKYSYALSGLVRCGHCRSVLIGQTIVDKRHGKGEADRIYPYYAHHLATVADKRCTRRVYADEIELAVFTALGEVLRDEAGIEKAVRDAIKLQHGDTTQAEHELAALTKLQKQDRTAFQAALAKLGERKSRIAEQSLQQLDESMAERESRIDELQVTLKREDVVAPDDIRKVAQVVRAITGYGGNAPQLWPNALKSKVARWLLGAKGTIKNDPKIGIFVSKPKQQSAKQWRTEINVRGLIGSFGAIVLPRDVSRTFRVDEVTGVDRDGKYAEPLPVLPGHKFDPRGLPRLAEIVLDFQPELERMKLIGTHETPTGPVHVGERKDRTTKVRPVKSNTKPCSAPKHERHEGIRGRSSRRRSRTTRRR